MDPVLVFVLHDPSGAMFPHLESVMPDLKAIFAQVFIGIHPLTREGQAERVRRLESDKFFALIDLPKGRSLRDDWLALYAFAASHCSPEQILHLCSIDRIAFALQGQFRDAFAADMRALQAENTPLLFHRSAAAWETHPRNYRELEQIVTRTGEFLFGQTLDFGWCHLAVLPKHILAVIPHIKNPDISMVAEIVLLLRHEMKTKDVDWLAWEDPFIFGRDPQQLKREREESAAETHKRLAYIIPMLQILDEEAQHMK